MTGSGKSRRRRGHADAALMTHSGDSAQLVGCKRRRYNHASDSAALGIRGLQKQITLIQSPRRREPWYICKNREGVVKKLDDAILEELYERGNGTVKDIGERLSNRVYAALKRLVEAGKVDEHGYPGKGNEKTYSLRSAKVGEFSASASTGKLRRI
jgi:hypothetical protein